MPLPAASLRVFCNAAGLAKLLTTKPGGIRALACGWRKTQRHWPFCGANWRQTGRLRPLFDTDLCRRHNRSGLCQNVAHPQVRPGSTRFRCAVALLENGDYRGEFHGFRMDLSISAFWQRSPFRPLFHRSGRGPRDDVNAGLGALPRHRRTTAPGSTVIMARPSRCAPKLGPSARPTRSKILLARRHPRRVRASPGAPEAGLLWTHDRQNIHPARAETGAPPTTHDLLSIQFRGIFPQFHWPNGETWRPKAASETTLAHCATSPRANSVTIQPGQLGPRNHEGREITKLYQVERVNIRSVKIPAIRRPRYAQTKQLRKSRRCVMDSMDIRHIIAPLTRERFLSEFWNNRCSISVAKRAASRLF